MMIPTRFEYAPSDQNLAISWKKL